ncbi:MAG: peptidoglycan-binding domain-containing protein [Syntrophomonadaceae bacterium]|jgi:hypothetical protein
MFKKFIVLITTMLLMAGTFSGCALKSQGEVETLEGLDKNVIQTRGQDKDEQQDDFMTEVKHWKYGVDQPDQADKSAPSPRVNPMTVGSDGNWNETTSIELLSSEDMDRIIAVLVKLGYLSQPTRSESKFRQALSKYQADHNLPATGTLDSATIERLSGEKQGKK